MDFFFFKEKQPPLVWFASKFLITPALCIHKKKQTVIAIHTRRNSAILCCIPAVCRGPVRASVIICLGAQLLKANVQQAQASSSTCACIGGCMFLCRGSKWAFESWDEMGFSPAFFFAGRVVRCCYCFLNVWWLWQQVVLLVEWFYFYLSPLSKKVTKDDDIGMYLVHASIVKLHQRMF